KRHDSRSGEERYRPRIPARPRQHQITGPAVVSEAGFVPNDARPWLRPGQGARRDGVAWWDVLGVDRNAPADVLLPNVDALAPREPRLPLVCVAEHAEQAVRVRPRLDAEEERAEPGVHSARDDGGPALPSAPAEAARFGHEPD